MALFNLSGDIQAFLLRVTASLDGIDDARRDLQVLIKNANAGVTELRQTIADVKAGLAGHGKPQA